MAQGIMRDDLYPELYRVEEHHWWHRQKRQVIHQLIKRYCQKQGRVLDVGCGTGKILEELQDLGWQVDGVDAPQAKAQTQRRNLKVKTADLQIEALPYVKNHFDLVVCLDTLEHMSDDKRLVAEMARVTKPKGIIIISVPAYQWLFSYWDKMLGHFRRYNRRDLLKAVPKKQVRLRFLSFYFSFLLVPAIIVRIAKAVLGQKQRSDFTTDPLSVFSHALVSLFGALELIWLKRFTIPFGLSLVGVFAKK